MEYPLVTGYHGPAQKGTELTEPCTMLMTHTAWNMTQSAMTSLYMKANYSYSYYSCRGVGALDVTDGVPSR
jgi:hypothetical protein